MFVKPATTREKLADLTVILVKMMTMEGNTNDLINDVAVELFSQRVAVKMHS